MRTPACTLAALVLCGLPLAAQQTLNRWCLYPVTSSVKDAGTVDVTTGKWTKPSQQLKGSTGYLYTAPAPGRGGLLRGLRQVRGELRRAQPPPLRGWATRATVQ